MTGESLAECGRHSIRLKGYDYSQTGGYFVTVVSHGRECLFGEVVDDAMQVNALGRIVQACRNEIPAHFPNAVVDTFGIMPNHVHGIIFIHEAGEARHASVGARYISPLQEPHGFKPGSVGAIVASFKAVVTRRAGRELVLHHTIYPGINQDREA